MMQLRPSAILVTLSSLCLALFGLATVFNLGGDNSLFYKQLTIIVVSFGVLFAVSFLDFSFLKKTHVALYTYLGIFLLLLILLLVGYTTNGAQSWFRIGGVSLQPVELAKFAVILVLAKYFHKRHVEIAHFSHIIISFMYTALVGFLVLLQPDLGSALVVFGVWAVLLFVSGISKKHIIFLGAIALCSIFVSWQFLFKQYQKDRILNFLDPVRDVRGSGYNVYQSMIAVGSGGVFGKGVDFGTQSNLAYLPEYETDFIFAAFAEEWGFVGVSLAILLFVVLITTIALSGMRTQDNFTILYSVGVVGYFLIHFIINVGMNIGMLPVTGIPLPFMSSGGTHILVECLMLGILISLTKHRSYKTGYRDVPL